MNRVNKIIENKLYADYMKRLCALEEDRVFCGHDLEHLLSVARIMLIKSYEENINIDKEIVYASSLLHDIGRVEEYERGVPHANASARIARIILSQSGYNPEETALITDAIADHNQTEPLSELGRLLRYADKISRNCFLCPAYAECKWSEEEKNKRVII